jgi:hypothetical protein
LSFLGMITIPCRLPRELLSTPSSNMFIILCLHSHRCPTCTESYILPAAVLSRLPQ